MTAGGGVVNHLTILSNGRVVVGGSTDTGYKFYCSAEARIDNYIFMGNFMYIGRGDFLQGGSDTTDLCLQAGGQSGRIIFAPNSTWSHTMNSSGLALGSTSTIVASAILSLTSTTRGFLPPRMTNAQRTAISSPAVGLIVYCTDATEGLYIYKSGGWTFVI